MWPHRRLLDLFAVEHPILLVLMAGPSTSDPAVAEAGGLGSLACAMCNARQVPASMGVIRQRSSRPVNLNFLTRTPTAPALGREAPWRVRLLPCYAQVGLDQSNGPTSGGRAPPDADRCGGAKELTPDVVSFHFGVPGDHLLQRVGAGGCKVIVKAVAQIKGLRGLFSLWSGRAACLGRDVPAPKLTRQVADETLHRLSAPSSRDSGEQGHPHA